MPYDIFGLDAIALFDADTPHLRIVAYHFNIPERLATERPTFEKILQQLETDFPAESANRVEVVPYFQISAVYTLIHNTTGTERLWQGSFNSRSRQRGQVVAFRPFDPATFVDFALARCHPRYVLQQLNTNTDQQDTVWTVGDLLSVVLTVQTTVHLRHPVFGRHPALRGVRHGRQRRRRAVFRLDLE